MKRKHNCSGFFVTNLPTATEKGNEKQIFFFISNDAMFAHLCADLPGYSKCLKVACLLFNFIRESRKLQEICI